MAHRQRIDPRRSAVSADAPGVARLSAPRAAPIGVFDSGVGGLTVLAALRRELPHADFLYLGDTARLPYGTKSAATVVRYALRAAETLLDGGVGRIVVACNTASAVALPALRERFPGLPLIGVVEPGAKAACSATRTGRVAILATEATVRGGAYERAIHRLRPDAHVTSLACPMFVALAEEGWHADAVAQAVAEKYLAPLFADEQVAPDCVVLGCTHFPLLREVIGRACAEGVQIVDSARTTAALVARDLRAAPLAAAQGTGSLRCLATDGIERFARVGSQFLGEPIDAMHVELVDI